MAARVFRAAQSLEELSKGFYGHWKDAKWVHSAISARYRNRLRKETLLSGEEWSYDKPRKEMKPKMKGHKCDRLAAEKRARTEELMKKMPQMLFDLKVPSYKGENMFVSHQFCGRGATVPFLGWGSQGRTLRGYVSSIFSQQWSSSMFARSLATMKGKIDRRKRDLARREFQLLRRKTKLLKATLSPEEKLLWRLRKAHRKKGVLLQRLKKYELEEDPEAVHDPELITAEQLQALKKIGYKNRNYVPVGRRGVYGGVVQNMHMHWKFHETVQVDCHIFKREDIRSVARQLTVLSGGIVIDIHQATNIIMYRGRNYKQPKKQMIPPNTLTKRKALFKSKHLQALDSLETIIRDIEGELYVVRQKQKESAAQGAENDTNRLQKLAGERVDKFLANLDGMQSEGEDDGLFSWGSDSLDEDELSDDDKVQHKEAKVVQEEKVMKPVSWSSGDSAPQSGKKKRLTAKELILAEQELFRSRRQAEAAQQLGSVSVQRDEQNNNKKTGLDECLKTDDEDNNAQNGYGINSKKSHGLQASEDHAELSETGSTGKEFEQIKNKKIAKFMKDFISDSDEEKEEFGSDFDDLDGRDKTCVTADMESLQTKSSHDEE